jgi:hypothetical protein
LNTTQTILNSALTAKANNHSLGILLPDFMQQVKDLVGDQGENLPHPLTFYYDLFASAHSLLFSRVNAKNTNKDFRAMLKADFPKFFGFVLDAHAEKH